MLMKKRDILKNLFSLNYVLLLVSEAPPEILLPLGIIEGRTMALDCIVEFQGTSGDIKWTFSPPGMSNTFYDLSIIPETKNSTTTCTTKLESKLTFTPGMYDNGSHFRCEVVNAQGYTGTTVLQETIPFYVIESKFIFCNAYYHFFGEYIRLIHFSFICFRGPCYLFIYLFI